MNKRIAMKWARALESGKYKKTKEQLKDETGYCCLGVLCEISGLDYDGYRGELPVSVGTWAEITGDVGLLPPRFKKNRSLVVLNDEAGYSFKDIAKVIRKYWKEL